MKKILISSVVTVMVITLITPLIKLSATDFEGQEDKYTKLCASSSLSKENEATCVSFNKYLKEKNEELKDEIADSKTIIEQTKNDITSVSAAIQKIKDDIATKESEISYLDTSINNLLADIDVKENLIKERMYAMQSYTNNNTYIDFVFGATSFTDMFSRISSINEITTYDKELITALGNDKKALEEQKSTVTDIKASLELQQKNQSALQNQYLALFEKENADLANQQNASASINNTSDKIEDNLETLYRISQASETSGNLTPGDSAVGNAIASMALTKLGSRYWWGASGPDYFDCSGLVYWAHNQAGVKLGRTTAAGYSKSGQNVPYSQLQPGDLITFYNYGYVSHIGIYIGAGKMVHASGRGSGTVGQYPNEKVMISSIAPGSLFYNLIYNCRRLY